MERNRIIDALPSCSICFEQYDCIRHLPSILHSCGHTFCKCCLDRIIETDNSHQRTSNCPICRAVMTNGFQTNYAIIELLQQIYQQKSTEKESKQMANANKSTHLLTSNKRNLSLSDEIVALKKKIDRQIDSEVIAQLYRAYERELARPHIDRQTKEQICIDLLNVINAIRTDSNDANLRLTIKSITYWIYSELSKYAIQPSNRHQIWSQLSDRYWSALHPTSTTQPNHPGRLFVFEDFVRLAYAYIDVVDRVELQRLRQLYSDVKAMPRGTLTGAQYAMSREILREGGGRSSIKYWLRKCDDDK